MAINFRELPIWVQVLVFLLIAVGLAVAAKYVPGSPLRDAEIELQQKTVERDQLQQQVTQLLTYERRRADLKSEIDALNKQLEILRTIVPEEKEVDEFIRILQGEAASAGVSIRRLTARPAAPRDYYIELPFDIDADGPYYAVEDFFSRLGRVPRVINVGDLTLNGIDPAKRTKYVVRPGTTVTGTFTATTFFTKGVEAPAAPVPGKGPGKAPGKQPAKR